MFILTWFVRGPHDESAPQILQASSRDDRAFPVFVPVPDSETQDVLRMMRVAYPHATEEEFLRFSKLLAVVGQCWVVAKGRTNKGYGRFEWDSEFYAHRVAFRWAQGRPIKERLEIDHLCKTRACVRPAHLEEVTAKINILRGQCKGAENARKVLCPKGHPFSRENTIVTTASSSGQKRRVCKLCHRAAWKKWKQNSMVAYEARDLRNG